MTATMNQVPKSMPHAAPQTQKKAHRHSSSSKGGIQNPDHSLKAELLSGFIVSLIALPLSLGIAMASGVPPMAGLISAIIGGIIVSRLSGSSVTINGPAAGMIVVVLSSVERLGGGVAGYRSTLAAVVIAGVMLVIFGLLRAGRLANFFPASVVHGMLAAIGIIIMAKQIPFMLGTQMHAKEPLELIFSLPEAILHANPAIASIAIISLILLVMLLTTRNRFLKHIPAPIAVVVAATLLGSIFGLDRSHDYLFLGTKHHLEPTACLVNLPMQLSDGLVMPDFSKATGYAFWLSVISIMLVQALESLLSCAAVNRLDPLNRKADLSRDVAAVGFGSIVAGAIGGLPIITEAVRSTANIANGGRTRWSNFFHGLFVLMAVLFAASLINRIPLAALAALLVITGCKLASPSVFKAVHKIGIDQTIVFLVTIISVLTTDLLIGVMIGIATKLILHLARGASFCELLSVRVAVIEHEHSIDVGIGGILIFTNFLTLKSQLDRLAPGKIVRIDLENARLVDHSSMEHLHAFAEEYGQTGGAVTLTGLHGHHRSSDHPLSTGSHPVQKLHRRFASFL